MPICYKGSPLATGVGWSHCYPGVLLAALAWRLAPQAVPPVTQRSASGRGKHAAGGDSPRCVYCALCHYKNKDCLPRWEAVLLIG
jgi:hypothetical protein